MTELELEESCSDEEISLDELTALALAADPNPSIDPDVQPFTLQQTPEFGTALPAWYMPAPLSTVRPGLRRWVIVGLVVLLLGIEASGLCSVFGQLVVG